MTQLKAAFTFDLTVAQLRAASTFDLTVAGQSPRHSIRLRGTGQGTAINSGGVLEMELELSALENGATRVSYACDADIFGRPAKVGEFVLKLKAREVQKQLQRNVRGALEGARPDH